MITAQQARKIAINDALVKFDSELFAHWDTSVMPTFNPDEGTYSVRFPLLGNLRGGSPFYTINAVTGQIVLRRFTQ